MTKSPKRIKAVKKKQAIDIVADSLISHAEWLSSNDKTSQYGDFKHHIKCIREYLKAIEFIKEL